jgi:VCBS repeat-containing protein
MMGVLLLQWLPINAMIVSSVPEPAPPSPPGKGPWVVRAHFSDREMVASLAAWKEPWQVSYQEGYLVVDVNLGEYERLIAAGFQLEIDEKLTEQLQKPLARLPGQVTGIPGYPCYRTVEETYEAASQMVTDHPNLATWIDIGDSWEKSAPGGNPGYDLRVLRLTNAAVPGPKPKLFLMGAIHAREYATAELVTRFGEYLVDQYNIDADVTWLLDHHEIQLLLIANPDGRRQAEAELSWRKNTNKNYCSPTSTSRGADLNRNFAFQWNCCGGSSGYECDSTYRGPTAASEPETQAIQDWVRTIFPDQREADLDSAAPPEATGLFIDVHAFGDLVLWPWGFDDLAAPNGTALQTLGRKFAFFNGYLPEQAADLYPTDGASDDSAYGELGVAAYTFELGNAFLQSCSDFGDMIVPDNIPAFLYAASVARTPYLTPTGPDVIELVADPPTAAAGDTILLTATIDDTRYQNSNGIEPTQEIAAAEFYIDTPPWITTTTPVANSMTVTDGLFDEAVEGVEASIDTSSLAVGRHLVYVRGQDADGNWGPISASFLHVMEPALSPPAAEITSDPGASVNYPMQARNNGNVTDTFSLEAAGTWPFGLDPATPFDLPPAASQELTVTITIPAGAPLGTHDHTTVTLRGEEQGEVVATSLLTTYAGCRPISGLSISLSPDAGLPGALVTLTGTATAGTQPIAYSWDLGDGSDILVGNPVTHTFPTLVTPAIYTVTLTADNACLGPATLSVPILAVPYTLYLPLTQY